MYVHFVFTRLNHFLSDRRYLANRIDMCDVAPGYVITVAV